MYKVKVFCFSYYFHPVIVPRGRADPKSPAWSAWDDISSLSTLTCVEWQQSRALSCLSSHSATYACILPVFVQAALKQSAHFANYVVFPLASGKNLLGELAHQLSCIAWTLKTKYKPKCLVSQFTWLGLQLFEPSTRPTGPVVAVYDFFQSICDHTSCLT